MPIFNVRIRDQWIATFERDIRLPVVWHDTNTTVRVQRRRDIFQALTLRAMGR
jgi:hypothetical protein